MYEQRSGHVRIGGHAGVSTRMLTPVGGEALQLPTAANGDNDAPDAEFTLTVMTVPLIGATGAYIEVNLSRPDLKSINLLLFVIVRDCPTHARLGRLGLFKGVLVTATRPLTCCKADKPGNDMKVPKLPPVMVRSPPTSFKPPRNTKAADPPPGQSPRGTSGRKTDKDPTNATVLNPGNM
jgi:hypothetical protein